MHKSIRFILIGLLMTLLIFGSADSAFANGDSNQRKMPLDKARQVLEEKIIDLPGIAGIAHREDTGEIIVLLESELPKERIPIQFEGFPVRTELTGKFQARTVGAADAVAPVSAYAASTDRLKAVSTLVGGVSVSAYVSGQGWAGTLGMVTYDNMILSNAHIMALDLNNKFLSAGTPIIQPGSYDGGTVLLDEAGKLYKYIPITFLPNASDNAAEALATHFPNAQNKADAAIATINTGIDYSMGKQFGTDSAYGDYTISGTTTVIPGDIVRKSGRTTGVTHNMVVMTNASVTIDYGGGKSARFVDQIIVWGPFSGAGDSGSAVDKDGKFVGLVFAGSSFASVVCKANYIIEGLGIAVEPPQSTATVNVNVSLSERIAGKNEFVSAIATVKVELDGAALNGATIEGHWSEPVYDSVSGVTGLSGMSFTSARVKNPPAGSAFTFVVDRVTKDGIVYNLDGNPNDSATR